MSRFSSAFFIATLLLTSLSQTACMTVKAYEKGNLAKKEMAFITDGLEQDMKDHIYFSKEASSSGTAVSGGGCGCN